METVLLIERRAARLAAGAAQERPLGNADIDHSAAEVDEKLERPQAKDYFGPAPENEQWS